ncbi:MAG: hypothetical protein ABIU05_11425 [Nitrospirales bacterium]
MPKNVDDRIRAIEQQIKIVQKTLAQIDLGGSPGHVSESRLAGGAPVFVAVVASHLWFAPPLPPPPDEEKRGVDLGDLLKRLSGYAGHLYKPLSEARKIISKKLGYLAAICCFLAP